MCAAGQLLSGQTPPQKYILIPHVFYILILYIIHFTGNIYDTTLNFSQSESTF